jgi:hypothetical protein
LNGFIVELKNEPGSLATLAEAIASKGINITAFTGAMCGDSGSVVILTNDDAGTRRAMADAGYKAREVELVTTALEHSPGTLAAVTRKLADGGVNIEAAVPTGMSEGKVTIAFATDQPEKARSILGTSQPAGIGIG